jgi:hypothetical protein
VLTVDVASQTVELDERLLRKQFQIGDGR